MTKSETLTVRQIAERLGMTKNGARSRLVRYGVPFEYGPDHRGVRARRYKWEDVEKYAAPSEPCPTCGRRPGGRPRKGLEAAS